MKFTRSEPCAECPFHLRNTHGYEEKRLEEFAQQPFPCHLTADQKPNGDYVIGKKSVACAGMLIYNEKRGNYTQTMQIAERLRIYDKNILNMEAAVR